ncbi:hypothetical protein QJS10_CPA05g02405 [Acorus calamus]|uniref:FPL domain-containing protein n=1 Tax=Acorus calamus TaxID=4465 RepID=A0AAV9ETY4_ACOCL|nr:hypothetical protein QJS10_CPA05g02405 [Acorus calamus]
MWFSFWRSRDRFSIDELRYLTEQLQKIQVVNEVNKDFVIEALRSIAELITYGDQHDPSFFEFFMEKQIMGEFVRILRISRTMSVALQMLQTLSIMIQNLKSEHAMYYIFSNEHINYLITYSFDFRNEELLSYYISFLRAVSGKLNKNTIPLLVKIKNDEVVSFPLYSEAIKFAFHEESMIRIAVRALMLNVYHVGDECVNGYVAGAPLSDYFSNLISHFQKQCINLDSLVSSHAEKEDQSDSSSILAAVDEIEDTLYYISDVISAGIPDLGRLITDNILQLLVFSLLLPSLKEQDNVTQIGTTTSLYLLCCILHIVKTRDLASSIAAALFCPREVFMKYRNSPNGDLSIHDASNDHQHPVPDTLEHADSSGALALNSSTGLITHGSFSLREILLSYIVHGDDVQVFGSLSLLATLLQTKELDESMLDGLGILPQRKQHKKFLLQALVGEEAGEEQLFSSEKSLVQNSISSELDVYVEQLKDKHGLIPCPGESGRSPQIHRYQVLDSLVSLFCRSDVSAEVLWAGGWLFRQLLPNSGEGFNGDHLNMLKDTYRNCKNVLAKETKGIWCDMLMALVIDEWKRSKRVIEAWSPQRDSRRILLPSRRHSSEGESSFSVGERMSETIKVFVFHQQLLLNSSGLALPDLPPVHSPSNPSINSRAKCAGLDLCVPKPGTEINTVDALPCRIAFERGKERHFCFLAISREMSGWVLLVEELIQQHRGVVRVAAPLAGSNPQIDEKHPRWLHLRIRPSTLPIWDPLKSNATGSAKSKALVDGRWTLAFRDEPSCKSAESMILEEMNLQSQEVEKRLKPLLDPLEASSEIS